MSYRDTLKTKKHRLIGLSLALLGGAFSSIAPAVVKIGVTAQIDPIPLLVYRFIISILVFWVLFPLLFPQNLRISLRTLGSCALVALSNTISLYAFYLAVSRIDASLVLMIFSFYPLAALVFLSFRGERITARYGVVFLLGFTGVYLLLGRGGSPDWIGIALSLTIPIFYALHMVLIQWNLSDTPPQTVALYTVTLMGIFISVVALPLGQVGGAMNSTGWTVILLTALVSTVLARLATFSGIQRIGSGQVALLGPVEILLGILWAFILLNEKLTLIQWLGGALVLTSASLVLISKKIETDQEEISTA